MEQTKFKVAFVVTIGDGDKCVGCSFLQFNTGYFVWSCMWNDEVGGGWGDELLRPESCKELDLEVT